MKNAGPTAVKSSFIAALISVIVMYTMVYGASRISDQFARQHRCRGVTASKVVGSTRQLFSSGAIQT